MADTHKDLAYLRFFYSSEESLKDKDILKAQAFEKYQQNVVGLFLIPLACQFGQIRYLNRASKVTQYKFFR